MTTQTLDPLADAVAWRKAHPAAYTQLAEWAREDMVYGCRPSIKLYWHLLRHPHFAERLGMRRKPGVIYAVNNSDCANVVRLLMREYPETLGSARGFEVRG